METSMLFLYIYGKFRDEWRNFSSIIKQVLLNVFLLTLISVGILYGQSARGRIRYFNINHKNLKFLMEISKT